MLPHMHRLRTRLVVLVVTTFASMPLTACVAYPVLLLDSSTTPSSRSLDSEGVMGTIPPPLTGRESSVDCSVFDTTAYQQLYWMPLADEEATRDWVAEHYNVESDSIDYQFGYIVSTDLPGQPRRKTSYVRWEANGISGFMTLFDERPYSLEVSWPDEPATLQDVLDCMGEPPGYDARYWEGPIGVKGTVFLSLYYFEQGIIVEAEVPAEKGLSELKRFPIFRDVNEAHEAHIELDIRMKEASMPRFIRSLNPDPSNLFGTGFTESYADLQRTIKSWPKSLKELYVYNVE